MSGFYKVFYHVFTSAGDLYVSDNAAGDERLAELGKTYPEATVTIKDRETGAALGKEVTLSELLHIKRYLLVLSVKPRAPRGWYEC